MTPQPENSASTEQDKGEHVWSWRDQLIMLLHIAAATEHALMVQYLYAAYSLDVDQKDHPELRRKVRRWQKSIIAIAKEEMGHLLTVENILTLLGGPINLDREDFPWDTPYYPFPFKLEPLTMQSLSCYVYAEMPDPKQLKIVGKTMKSQFQPLDYKEYIAIQEAVKTAVNRGPRENPHRVGELYEKIIKCVEDPKLIDNSAFREVTFGFQASWDDWGRGYQPDPELLDPHGGLIKAEARSRKKPPRCPPSGRDAHVIIEQVATRTQVVDALRRIAGQGEASHLAAKKTTEPSHFERFCEIYKEFEKESKDIKNWTPSYNVAINPSTRSPHDGGTGHYIENPYSRDWANLFNLRYRLLLTCLAHTFQLARVTRADEPSVRAMVMHRVFGEMYNLKTIAGILVRCPVNRRANNSFKRAGPPFETPYSLRLPPTESDTWWLHRELISAAGDLCHTLLRHADESERRYLNTLKHLDKQSLVWIDGILAGLRTSERQHL